MRAMGLKGYGQYYDLISVCHSHGHACVHMEDRGPRPALIPRCCQPFLLYEKLTPSNISLLFLEMRNLP